MRTKNVLLTLLAATAMTGCNKADDPQEVSKLITINAGVGTLTRATATAFVKDDQVSIYAWTGSNTTVQTPLVVDNSVNTYDGTNWTASPQMLWKDNTSAHYFIGVHPVKAITDFTADAYATTPDLLVATVLGSGQKATDADGEVAMTFDHVMARLDVNLTFRTEFGNNPAVSSVTVNAQPGAKVNYLTKTATADGAAAEVAMMMTTANIAYSQVVATQGINKITIKIGDKDYVYNNTAGFALLAGKIQTVNLIVGRDKIELGSVTINDWATGETINGGEALN